MIYVIKAANTDYTKIGIAANPTSRMRVMQTGMPYKLVLVASADWADKYERRIHRALFTTSVRGEWFLWDDRIASLVRHMHSGRADPLAWFEESKPPVRLAKVIKLAM